jgi:putative hydrolase
MKPLIADMHMHTLMSGHAFGTVREMAAQAAEQNMRLIGIAEHGPGIPGTCDPIYFRNICDAPRSLFGVEMLYGSEVNILNDGILSLDDRHLRYLDYAIAGIHLHCYDNSDIVTNTDNVIRVMEKSKVKFISHPDDSKIPLDYPALVQGARATGTALEVNNSSLRKPFLRKNCLENYRIMLSLCMEHRVPIIVNTDSHDPSTVGDFTLAYKLLEEMEFDEDLILNNDPEKVKNFLLK